MSENIQSISQGTFTIGNTNELTFSAGPGISIDQPSEGVVRIGNDETVLYTSSDGTNSDVDFSETRNNFEYIRIIYRLVRLVLQDSVGCSVVSREENDILSFAQCTVKIVEEVSKLLVKFDILAVGYLCMSAKGMTNDIWTRERNAYHVCLSALP